MKSVNSSNFTNGNLPVFVFPETLTFYADDQSSHKQPLTIYNPYEFCLRFKVFCTAPSRYVVVDAEGIIKPRCCIDIIIRRLGITRNVHEQDKFRLHIFENGVQKAIGQKEIIAVLQPSKKSSHKKGNRGRSSSSSSDYAVDYPRRQSTRFSEQAALENTPGSGGPSIWVIFLAVGCIVALMLPTQGDIASKMPDYLFLSVNQKLIAAFILGLITMSVLKS